MQISNRIMTSTIVDGSVTMEKLDAAIQTEFRQYMLDAQAARDAALQYQKYAKRYAEDFTGSETDNAKYYYEQAKANADTSTAAAGTATQQVSAQGTNKATADAIGVVKPDGETIAVDAAGTISAKKATESTFGIVSGGTGGVIVGSDGVMSVDTTFTQDTELANIIAAEAFSRALGKISKAIATTMNLDENALLKSMQQR